VETETTSKSGEAGATESNGGERVGSGKEAGSDDGGNRNGIGRNSERGAVT
jgi:hypothetical protein